MRFQLREMKFSVSLFLALIKLKLSFEFGKERNWQEIDKRNTLNLYFLFPGATKPPHYLLRRLKPIYSKHQC